ncbi:MAG: amylo-alpha-1,6-glucosidase [Planctomycetota bacterium]
MPFSHRGSYLAVSHLEPPAAPVAGLWLCSSRLLFQQSCLLRLSLLREGQEFALHYSMTPACLRLHSEDDAWAELVFADPDRLLLRVSGCELLLEAPGGDAGAGADFTLDAAISQITPAGPERWRAVCGSVALLHMHAAAGEVHVQARWTGAGSCDNRLVLDGRNQPAVLVLQESDGLEGVSSAPVDIDASRDRASAAFAACDAMRPTVPAEHAQLARDAAYLTWSSLVAPSGRLRHEGMLMSKQRMSSVWSWDHCFNALALRHGQPDLAWMQFHLPFAESSLEGCLPDTVQNGLIIRTFTKPPVHGWCFRQLWQAAPDWYTSARLQQAYRDLSDWTDYWLQQRDPYGTGLPVYYHGNDSGWDNGTVFLAGSPICSPELPALLVVQMRVLEEIARALGQPAAAAMWRQRADALLQRLLEQCWTGEGWRVLCPHDPQAAPPPEADSLMPWVALVLGEDLPRDCLQRSVAAITDTARFRTQWGLATESQRSPYYRDDGYWRGPIWAPYTLLIIDGLTRAGETGLARALCADFCRLCQRGGFAENFDAQRGEGLRDRAYTWTASVFLECARRLLPVE